METVAVIHRFETMPQTRAGLRAVAVLTQGHCFIRQRRDEALRLGMVSRSTAPAPPAPHLRGFEPARVGLGGILYAAIRMLDETGSPPVAWPGRAPSAGAVVATSADINGLPGGSAHAVARRAAARLFFIGHGPWSPDP
jgi:hypothetical protein